MLGLKLNHVSKWGQGSIELIDHAYSSSKLVINDEQEWAYNKQLLKSIVNYIN